MRISDWSSDVCSSDLIGSLLTNNYPLFIILTAISIFLVASYLAPTYSTIQSAVDPSARSFAAAVTMFCISGIGLASGAFICGLFSDLLRPVYGAGSLRAAPIILSLFQLWVGLGCATCGERGFV